MPDRQAVPDGLEGEYRNLPRAEGVLLLSDIKRAVRQAAVQESARPAVWDIGDGVLCLEFTSKIQLDGRA